MAGLDLKSFRALFDRQYLKVCNYIQVKTSCDWSQCEGIAREAFVSLWKGRESMSQERSPLSLLLEIVRQKLLTDYGISSHTNHHDDATVGREAFRDPEYIPWEWAINKLDPTLREIFLLRKQKNYSICEIAEILDTSIQSVEEYLKKALVELHTLLIDFLPSNSQTHSSFSRQT
jgi:RNA polymerase sigma factor (sigma-70 family)